MMTIIYRELPSPKVKVLYFILVEAYPFTPGEGFFYKFTSTLMGLFSFLSIPIYFNVSEAE